MTKAEKCFSIKMDAMTKKIIRNRFYYGNMTNWFRKGFPQKKTKTDNMKAEEIN